MERPAAAETLGCWLGGVAGRPVRPLTGSASWQAARLGRRDGELRGCPDPVVMAVWFLSEMDSHCKVPWPPRAATTKFHNSLGFRQRKSEREAGAGTNCSLRLRGEPLPFPASGGCWQPLARAGPPSLSTSAQDGLQLFAHSLFMGTPISTV